MTEHQTTSRINSDTSKQLRDAARKGLIERVKALVFEQGADVNDDDHNNQTPLHHASSHGHLDIVKFLVEQGSNENAYDCHHMTPLHYAAWQGHIEIVKYLVDKCADVNACKGNGPPPLYYAVSEGHLDVVRFLIAECGADEDVTNDFGETLLHHAAYEGHVDIVKALVFEYGMDVDLKSHNDETPLIYATRRGHIDIVEVLESEEPTDVACSRPIKRRKMFDGEENDRDNVGNRLVECAALSGWSGWARYDTKGYLSLFMERKCRGWVWVHVFFFF